MDTMATAGNLDGQLMTSPLHVLAGPWVTSGMTYVCFLQTRWEVLVAFQGIPQGLPPIQLLHATRSPGDKTPGHPKPNQSFNYFFYFFIEG